MDTRNEQDSARSHHKASTSQSALLQIHREFSAPVERLFAAFKTPEALKAWWWPQGLYADRVDLDFREGGHYFINMKGFDQGGGGMTGNFEEIVDLRRIVMQDQFADEAGRPITAAEAKMPGVWPQMVYITFDFDSLSEKTCRVNLSQQGIPNEAQKDCIQGWSQMFDKLESYLNKSSR